MPDESKHLEKKRCPRCKDIKLLEQFYNNKSRRDGKSSWCKACACLFNRKDRQRNPEKDRASSRKWRRANPEKARINNKKWRDKNPDKIKALNKRWKTENHERHNELVKQWRKKNPERARNIVLKSTYGITYDEYNELLISQAGCCAVCHEVLKKGKRHHPVDHNHKKKGRESVRGIVHHRCNLLIGFLERTPGIIDKAKDYLSSKCSPFEA